MDVSIQTEIMIIPSHIVAKYKLQIFEQIKNRFHCTFASITHLVVSTLTLTKVNVIAMKPTWNYFWHSTGLRNRTEAHLNFLSKQKISKQKN